MPLSERALMEADLADQVEGDFAYPVTVKGGPDGLSYSLSGFVQYDARKESSDGLGAVIVMECAVTLRISSCPSWMFAQPFSPFEVITYNDPSTTAASVSRLVDGAKAMEVNRTLGIVRLYPKRARQS